MLLEHLAAIATERGMRGGGSFSARMVQEGATDGALDALFRQAGVIRVDTLSELFDVAALLTSQPLPAGCRVAVVGNSVELGQLATQACVGGELEVGPLSSATHETLRSALGPNAVPANPIVLPPGSDADALRCTLDAVLRERRGRQAGRVGVPIGGWTAGRGRTPGAGRCCIAVLAGRGGLFACQDGGVRRVASPARGNDPADRGIDPDRARGLVHSELTVAWPGVDLSADAVPDLLFGAPDVIRARRDGDGPAGDRAFRIVALTDLDAAELIRSVRAALLPFGYRGSEPMDVQALEQLLLRARLVDDAGDVSTASEDVLHDEPCHSIPSMQSPSGCMQTARSRRAPSRIRTITPCSWAFVAQPPWRTPSGPLKATR